MFEDVNKILILAPHPDDAEFGLGGTISKLLKMGKEIHVAVFSDCEKSTPKGFKKGVILEELYKSTAFLGIDKSKIHLFDFEVRLFPSLRQEILETLVKLRAELQPDLVFLPSSSDIHQDHNTIHIEGIRAFKHCNVLGYEMPWNNFEFKSYVYVALSREEIDKKIGALELYASQAHRPYSAVEFVESLAKIRAIQINKEYAESFEMIRFIQH